MFRKNLSGKYLLKALGAIYFAGLLYLTFFIKRRQVSANYRSSLNLRVLDKFKSYDSFGADLKINLFTEILGNIAIFLPFTPAVCFVFGYKPANKLLVLYTLSATCFIEICQYIFSRGVADIDDIILNFTGGILGLLLFNYIYKKLGYEDSHFWN